MQVERNGEFTEGLGVEGEAGEVWGGCIVGLQEEV